MRTRTVALFCTLGLLACGDSGNTQTDPDVGKTYSQAISAATGGTLQNASGGAVLQVPAGALTADTTLTLSVAAPESGTAAAVYNFGPDGTTFSKPATLALKWTGDAGDKKPVLATYSEGKWTEISGSSLSNGVVTGSVSHFSKFTIILVANGTIGTTDCSTNFSACGGSLIGTWKFTNICMPAIAQNPFSGCSGFKVSVDVDWDANYTFDATKITSSAHTETTVTTMEIPKSCMNNMPCTSFGKDCQDTGSACKCVSTSTENKSESSMDYTVNGTNLVVNSGGSQESIPYCVSGNTLKMKVSFTSNEQTYDAYYTLGKQ